MAEIAGSGSALDMYSARSMAEQAGPYSDNGINALGQMLHGTYKRWQSDRRWKEQVWLQNLRQFRGIYGSDVIIPKNRSQAYPKITRAKVVTAVSKLMEMLFPTSDKNWALHPNENPQISQDVLDEAQATLGQMQPGPEMDKALDMAIRVALQNRTANMSDLVQSQLGDEYILLIRNVVKSAVMYGTGVLHGPFVNMQSLMRPVYDPMQGKYVLTQTQTMQPEFQFISIWDFYPDLSAFTWAQCDGYFFRHVMNRAGLRALADRPDFLRTQILNYLSNHQTGNYTPTYFENEIKAMGSQKMPSGSSDKFEVMSYWGTVSGHMLAQTGMPEFQNLEAETVECNLYLIDNVVIKAKLNPYKAQFRPVHIFTYEEDDSSLLGDGIPSIMEDSQRALCAAARMLYDNASATAGPMVEVNIDLLDDPVSDAQDSAIRPYKVFPRIGTGAMASVPAIRDISVSNHVPELLNIIKLAQEFADRETSVQLANLNEQNINSEAMRTTVGISMLFGNSNTNLRNVVRNFDAFTTSIINAMVHWNMQFNNSPAIQGDHAVVARGSTALVARELHTQALDALHTSLSEDEKLYINTKSMLTARLKAHDLDASQLLNSDENIQNAQTAAAQQAEQAQDLSRQKTLAEVKQALGTAYMNIAKGDAQQIQMAQQAFQVIYQQLGALDANGGQGEPGAGAGQTPQGMGLGNDGSVQGGAIMGDGGSGGITSTGSGLPGFSTASAAVPISARSYQSARTAPVSQ